MTPEEYEPIKDQRALWREEINEIEGAGDVVHSPLAY